MASSIPSQLVIMHNTTHPLICLQFRLNSKLIAKRVASTRAHVLLPTRRFDWFNTYYVIERCDGHAAVVDMALMDTLQ